MLFKTLGLTALLSACAQATLQIVPGATWTATNTGKHVQAHGAGIIKVGSTFYMIGEDKTDGSAFQNINCYSSTNLVEWTYVGALLSRTASGDLGPNRVVERPKVIFNQSTGKYVLYLHIDSSDYGEAKVGVATGDSVCGKYNYLGSWRPLGFQSRDQGLFQDTDGKAYLLTEDRANGLRINALTADYLNTTGTSSVYLWNRSIESPAILKQGGYYFMFGSLLTGWDPNDNVYSYATSLSGPWSAWQNFAPAGSKTFTSQTTYILPLSSTTAIYMGDRWVSTNLMRSTYVWLPLTISGTSVTMSDRVNWTPNVSAVLANGAVVISCTGCSGGSAAGYIGGSSGGSVTFSNVRADVTGRTTIRVKHLNGNTVQRFADVTVNGVTQRVAFLPTQDGNTPGSSVVHANLNAGIANTIVVRITDGSYGPDVDRLMIPLS
ncbi:galactan 1,3-beta-galactosidase [Microdochium trichocladiopsis]|uniref:Galactan 1,3-beta-galactosidase n=1 Tax=Microdochium trichocladiopsis TaxID=1682393 RepID=A0A9P8XV90_9PEZI|nr:galactan 1,3-beta-galactosidase [Microdochium trichocladiopsis]KAH7014383.1 galactan 1,3-beta-galactosidase [Microdochium trichocladiopsis]